MPITHLCLPVYSDGDVIGNSRPDAFSVETKLLAESKPLVDIARLINKDAKGFRHIEFNWSHGTWLAVGKRVQKPFFLSHDPQEAGWATDYCDEPGLAPVNGFSIRTSGHYIEFRCYDADTSIESWTDPILLRGDLVVCGSLAYNLLTGEVTEVDDVQ